MTTYQLPHVPWASRFRLIVTHSVWGVARAIEQVPQRPPARIARTAPRVALPPHASETALRALWHADDARHAPGGQQCAQRHIGAATVCRHAHPPAPHLPEDPGHGPAHHRACIAFPTTCEHRRVIGPPGDGHSAPARAERHDQQGLLPCDRPSDRQPDRALGREVDAGLQEHRLGHVPWLQALIVQQARQPLRRGFLIAKAARPLGLTAGLPVAYGRHKVPHGLALMAMCPGQPRRDIMVQTSSRRVLSFHIPRLA